MTQLSFSIENILKEDFPNRSPVPQRVRPLRFGVPYSRLDGDLCFPVHPYSALRYGPVVYHLSYPEPKEPTYNNTNGLWYAPIHCTARSKEILDTDKEQANSTKSRGQDRKEISNSTEDEPKTEFARQRECTQVLKKKRFRSHFSQRQLKYLENVFSRQQYLSRDERALLAKALEMTELQIRNWFQNRRYQKRQREQVQKQKDDSDVASCEEKDS